MQVKYYLSQVNFILVKLRTKLFWKLCFMMHSSSF